MVIFCGKLVIISSGKLVKITKIHQDNLNSLTGMCQMKIKALPEIQLTGPGGIIKNLRL